MSVNSSSPPLDSSSETIYDLLQNCNRPSCTSSFAGFTACSVLLVVPPCVYVIYLGLKQWRSGTRASSSDIFTYHMVAVELMNVTGTLLICFGSLARLPGVVFGGLYLNGINTYGQLYYHTLTCVERYLAVVHPVTYLGLRSQKGARVRNISIGCVWLLCFANVGLASVSEPSLVYVLPYCTFAFMFIVVSFCSLSVLCVLIGPGPGAGGEGRERVDRSKMRAFYTVMVIMGVLLVRLVETRATLVYMAAVQLGQYERCDIWMSVFWMSLPSSLVLPLLFVHRAGKLYCKNINQRGQGSD